METITITTINGPETVKARPTPCPGLAITGKRGAWTITHVESGKSVLNRTVNSTLEDIRTAMMGATMADMRMGSQGPVDWTACEASLAERAGDCSAWVRCFRSVLDCLQGEDSRPASWCDTTEDILRNWER